MLTEKQLIHERPELRNRAGVFADRHEAGEALAGLLADYRASDAIVLAIPAGGVPVGAALAAALELPLDVAVVSKITLPWNTEAGYGAVAFDGNALLNEALLSQLALSDADVQRGIAATRAKVAARVARFAAGRPLPSLAGRVVIIVDDGLASGYTLRAALRAIRTKGPRELIVAVPTAHREAAEQIAREADALYCANVRAGWSYAVADAYRAWRDVSEDEAAGLLTATRAGRGQ